jgi:hypothetical protein
MLSTDNSMNASPRKHNTPADPMQPTYTFSPSILARFAFAALAGLRRSFHADSQALVKGIHPPVCILGAENIPSKGYILLLVNHFSRPGFGIWWANFAICAAIPRETRVVMANAWTFTGQPWAGIKHAAMSWFLARITAVYHFLPMPSLSPHATTTPQARAAGVRGIIQAVRCDPDVIIVLAPEGGDSPDGKLSLPAVGTGRFIQHLADMGMTLQPVGIYEENGRLFIRFGAAFELPAAVSLSPQQIDEQVRRAVFSGLAGFLPDRLSEGVLLSE